MDTQNMPHDKIEATLQHIAGLDLDDMESGESLSAAFETLRTYSLASLALDLHELRRYLEDDGLTVFPSNAMRELFQPAFKWAVGPVHTHPPGELCDEDCPEGRAMRQRAQNTR